MKINVVAVDTTSMVGNAIKLMVQCKSMSVGVVKSKFGCNQ